MAAGESVLELELQEDLQVAVQRSAELLNMFAT